MLIGGSGIRRIGGDDVVILSGEGDGGLRFDPGENGIWVRKGSNRITVRSLGRLKNSIMKLPKRYFQRR